MFEGFMIRAVLSGVALALVAGPLGCFIIWKRLAYFGDALAHSALLGVALALYLQIYTTLGVFFIAVLISLSLIALRNTAIFAGDTALGILSHSALAFGLIALSLSAPGQVPLSALLFGDILAVTRQDVLTSFGVAFVILVLLIYQWRVFIAHTFSADIARAERIGSASSEVLFLVLCSGLVAIAMKITGILLISALLILPAAIARIFARSPEQMAILAALFGVLAVLSGLVMSLGFDLPPGPAIIATAGVFFATSLLLSRLFSVNRNSK